MNSKKAYSIGHSTRKIEDFLKTLSAYEINFLADIRKIPMSARNPQFSRNSLEKTLESNKIQYNHFIGLGGLRQPNKETTENSGWRNSSFRGYADYMLTEEFEKNLQVLINVAEKNHLVFMCAEVLPWKCHRSLLSDALVVRGFEVIEIFDETHSREHVITNWARVEGTKISYPIIERKKED
jgi:uncharacterized protein (DUF488 family)